MRSDLRNAVRRAESVSLLPFPAFIIIQSRLVILASVHCSLNGFSCIDRLALPCPLTSLVRIMRSV